MKCYVSFTSSSYASIKLNIAQFQSNAYHPESQGALERFHQILKHMMKTFCLDSQKDWDDGVHILLFATRRSLLKENGFMKILLLVF